MITSLSVNVLSCLACAVKVYISLFNDCSCKINIVKMSYYLSIAVFMVFWFAQTKGSIFHCDIDMVQRTCVHKLFEAGCI